MEIKGKLKSIRIEGSGATEEFNQVADNQSTIKISLEELKEQHPEIFTKEQPELSPNTLLTIKNCLKYCRHRLIHHPEAGLHKTGCHLIHIDKVLNALNIEIEQPQITIPKLYPCPTCGTLHKEQLASEIEELDIDDFRPPKQQYHPKDSLYIDKINELIRFHNKLYEMNIGERIRRKYLVYEHASITGITYANAVPPETTKALHGRAFNVKLVNREDLKNITKEIEAEIIANLPAFVS